MQNQLQSSSAAQYAVSSADSSSPPAGPAVSTKTAAHDINAAAQSQNTVSQKNHFLMRSRMLYKQYH